jgi:hypothetical protein
MWSYIQYRKIGKQVDEEIKVNSQRLRNQNNHAETGHSGGKLKPGSLRGSLSESRLKSGMHSDGREQSEKSKDSNTSSERIEVVTSGDDDPFDPRKWSLPSRYKNIAISSVLIFLQAWSGAAGSMANTAASKEFHVGKVAGN